MHVQLIQEFFCVSPRVPVFNVGGDATMFEIFMFIKFTRNADDVSIDMDFETLDKNELRQ